MPIRNYTTSVPANRSIEEIQTALVKHGATGVMYEYEQGTGRIQALKFRLPVNGQDVGFSLPVEWRRFQAVLQHQRVTRWRDEDYVYRVAWRNIRDWVMYQLALYETQMVDMPQVFLPFAISRGGKTLCEHVQDQKFLLGDGNNTC
jgi:hypothetical protein